MKLISCGPCDRKSGFKTVAFLLRLSILCTCNATSLSKMARRVWRYSDDAGIII